MITFLMNYSSFGYKLCNNCMHPPSIDQFGLSDFICLFLPEIVCTKYIVVDLCQINVSQNPLKSTSLLYGKVEFFMFNMFSFMHDLTYQLLVHREKLINEWRMTPDKLLKGCTPLIFYRVVLLMCVSYTSSTVCNV